MNNGHVLKIYLLEVDTVQLEVDALGDCIEKNQLLCCVLLATPTHVIMNFPTKPLIEI